MTHSYTNPPNVNHARCGPVGERKATPGRDMKEFTIRRTTEGSSQTKDAS